MSSLCCGSDLWFVVYSTSAFEFEEAPSFEPLRGKKRAKERLFLRNLLVNLFVAKYYHACLIVPMRHDAYSKGKYMRKLRVKRRMMLRSIALLEKNGFISRISGFWNSQKGRGVCTRFMPSDKLLALCPDFRRMVEKTIETYNTKRTLRCVIIRDNDIEKKPDYADNRFIAEEEKFLCAYNSFLGTFVIAYKGGADGLQRKIFPRLVRIYSGSLSRGGRFYASGISWQNITREERKTIRISDSDTVELDYKCLHIVLAYARQGINFAGDAYLIEGIPAKYRPIIKRALLILINSKSENKVISTLCNDLNESTDDDLKRLYYSFCNEYGLPEDKRKFLQLIKQRHAPIADLFCSDIGARLQLVDSNIMRDVMCECMRNRIPALPLHDSVVVPEEGEQVVRAIMLSAYKRHIGPKFDIVVESKNRSASRAA